MVAVLAIGSYWYVGAIGEQPVQQEDNEFDMMRSSP